MYCGNSKGLEIVKPVDGGLLVLLKKYPVMTSYKLGTRKNLTQVYSRHPCGKTSDGTSFC